MESLESWEKTTDFSPSSPKDELISFFEQQQKKSINNRNENELTTI